MTGKMGSTNDDKMLTAENKAWIDFVGKYFRSKQSHENKQSQIDNLREQLFQKGFWALPYSSFHQHLQRFCWLSKRGGGGKCHQKWGKVRNTRGLPSLREAAGEGTNIWTWEGETNFLFDEQLLIFSGQDLHHPHCHQQHNHNRHHSKGDAFELYKKGKQTFSGRSTLMMSAFTSLKFSGKVVSSMMMLMTNVLIMKMISKHWSPNSWWNEATSVFYSP